MSFKVAESPTGGNAVRSVDVVRVPKAELNAQYDRNVAANGNGGPTGTSPSLESGGGEGYNGSGEGNNNAYLRILNDVARARELGMTAREYAMSRGVPSSLTDAEAASLDLYNLKWFDDGAGITPRTYNSQDKYVGETANAIESIFPQRVVSVNRVVYRPDGTTLTDFDIELDNVVIQVKSGSGKKLITQMKKTQEGTDKIVIGYTPDLKKSSSVVRMAKISGFEVFTTWEDLLDYLLSY